MKKAMNKYELFQRVALARDFPEKRRGDVATIVDRHSDPNAESLVIRSKFLMPSLKRSR